MKAPGTRRGVRGGGGQPPTLPRDARSAIALQKHLAGKVRLDDDLTEIVRSVAGVDVAFPDHGRRTRAAVVVLAWPGLERLAEAVAEIDTVFPYVPGLLSFRELPAIVEALEKLELRPDLVLCDGQGVAHPRRFGIACHLGVVTGLAAIGVAKSRLCGEYVEPGPDKGSTSPLLDDGERIGTVLRTRTGVRPVFVSPGHRVGQETAVKWALATARRFRLPEPVRAADRLAGGQSSATCSA